MTQCDPNDAIPKTCADAFQSLAVGQGKIEAQVTALVTQTTRINGSVADLYERTNKSTTDRAENRIKVKALEAAVALSGSRAWQIVLMVLTLVAGIVIGRLCGK